MNELLAHPTPRLALPLTLAVAVIGLVLVVQHYRMWRELRGIPKAKVRR